MQNRNGSRRINLVEFFVVGIGLGKDKKDMNFQREMYSQEKKTKEKEEKEHFNQHTTEIQGKGRELKL